MWVLWAAGSEGESKIWKGSPFKAFCILYVHTLIVTALLPRVLRVLWASLVNEVGTKLLMLLIEHLEVDQASTLRGLMTAFRGLHKSF